MVWRVSGWLRDLGMSQVSGFDFLHIVYLYRFDLDPATSTSPSIESNDSIQTFWIVLGWLHCASALQVSCFVPLHLFVIDVLGPEVYRFNLHLIALTLGSNDPIATFQNVCGWLHRSGVF